MKERMENEEKKNLMNEEGKELRRLPSSAETEDGMIDAKKNVTGQIDGDHQSSGIGEIQHILYTAFKEVYDRSSENEYHEDGNERVGRDEWERTQGEFTKDEANAREIIQILSKEKIIGERRDTLMLNELRNQGIQAGPEV